MVTKKLTINNKRKAVHVLAKNNKLMQQNA